MTTIEFLGILKMPGSYACPILYSIPEPAVGRCYVLATTRAVMPTERLISPPGLVINIHQRPNLRPGKYVEQTVDLIALPPLDINQPFIGIL